MDTRGPRRLCRSSSSYLIRPARRPDFFHGLIYALGVVTLVVDPWDTSSKSLKNRRRAAVFG